MLAKYISRIPRDVNEEEADAQIHTARVLHREPFCCLRREEHVASELARANMDRMWTEAL